MIFLVAPLSGFFGSFALYACDQAFPAPMGFVWFRPVGKTIELLYVFVHEDFRRRGIATAMLGDLKQRFPGHDFIGAKVNVMSQPWVEKNGFVQSKTGWTLTT